MYQSFDKNSISGKFSNKYAPVCQFENRVIRLSMEMIIDGLAVRVRPLIAVFS